jgi:hypothetical protein
MLAVERAWVKKMNEINVRILLLPPSTNGISAPPLVRWSVFQQKPLIERVVKLIGFPHLAQSDENKVVEGSAQDELAFFKKVVVPRLQEAGFTRISLFMEEVDKAARQSKSPLGDLEWLIPYGPRDHHNLEWLCEFKAAWRRVCALGVPLAVCN